MGNKIYIDNRTIELDEILNFNIDNLKASSESLNELDFHCENYKNLKVWRFLEGEDDRINSESVKLIKIKEDRFLLSSYETYIILIIFKNKDDNEDMTIFPNSLWGIVESSSNMTPRGLKYAFSTSCSENLESFLLSKRDFKNSEYKYLLFIWNGKNCAPLLKSHVLMKAFELDKKLSNPIILPFLNNGYYIENHKFNKSSVVSLNQIINNTFENLTEEPSTPSTESFINYHETVYLLQILYPKKMNKKNKIPSNVQNKKNILFPIFNRTFLNTKEKVNYYDNFINLDSSLILNSKRSQLSKENINNLETFSLRKKNRFNNDIEDEEHKSLENLNNEYYEGEEEYEEDDLNDDLNDDLYFEGITNRGLMSKIENNNFSIKNNLTVNHQINTNKINFNNLINSNFSNKLNEKDLTLSSNRNNNNNNNSNRQANISSKNTYDDCVNASEDSFHNIPITAFTNKRILIKNKKENLTNIENINCNNENFSFNEMMTYNSSNKNIANENHSLVTNSNNQNSLKINLNANKNSLLNNYNNSNINNTSSHIKQNTQINEIKIPKLIMGIQQKILNDDVISQRISQQSVEEEKLDNLPYSVIKKSSDKIFTLKKLDIKNILDNKNNPSNAESINSLKANLGKLDIMKINEDFNIRDSDRKNIIMDFFSKNISEILDKFLYISNYIVAKNNDIIRENKITHIINAAADSCQNHFMDEGVVYLNYYLKDHPMEVLSKL